jgi:RNA polymerase sigma factor (sigma-70 family)
MTGSPDHGSEVVDPGTPRKSERLAEFEEFFAQHKDGFLRQAVSKLRNLHDADEAVMDAAMKIYEKWHQIRDHADPLNCARKIVHDAAIDFYRKQARRAEREVPYPPNAYAWAPTADDLLEMRGYDRLDRARAALEERAPKQAECVRLRYLDNQDPEDIAEYLNISKGAAKSNVSLGLKALHDLMDLPDPGKEDS